MYPGRWLGAGSVQGTCVSGTGLSFITLGPMAAGVRVSVEVGPDAAHCLTQRNETEPNQDTLFGSVCFFPRLAKLSFCLPRLLPDLLLHRKMRSSEKYLRLQVQSKYWKAIGLQFRCSLEGTPHCLLTAGIDNFLLEMSCAFH